MRPSALVSTSPIPSPPDSLFLRETFLQLGARGELEDQIHSIEADRNYLEVHTQSGRFTLRRTLNSFLAELGSDAFCRVHRSVAVRRDAVRKLMPLKRTLLWSPHKPGPH